MPDPRPLPVVTPLALALVLGAGAFFGAAGHVPIRVEAGATWATAFWLAAGGFFAAGVRARVAGPSGVGAAALRLAAVTVAAAYLVRRAGAVANVAIAELPANEQVVGRLDVSELLSLGLLALMGLGASGATLRRARPGLLVLGLSALAFLGWVVAVNSWSFAGPSGALSAASWPALALAWIGCLIASPALEPAPGRAARAALGVAPSFGAAAVVFLTGFLASKAPRIEDDGAALHLMGRALGLPFGAGTHVAAGAELVVLLVAAAAVLALGARAAHRAAPSLPLWAPTAAAAVAGLLVLFLTESRLLPLCAVLGWATALLSIGRGTPE